MPAFHSPVACLDATPATGVYRAGIQNQLLLMLDGHRAYLAAAASGPFWRTAG
jgi:hypothetical protein